ncbi:DNA repair protein RecO [Clostridium acetireducens DSM 10703]|uniref:DNA repair protein RecO n=1 Tax=Clostridium acetireducens DSM 10703 TaxID=1121290 RepID=A0A1E8F152_9CLOT|nr:DNA repair protein RecO [Clostridium acetireducens]OFI07176.1 DNA repair protein RecO [Clostridium acetireducens DSM 10703]
MFGDDFLGIIKTRAVVIKTQDYKESDKLVWLFSEKLGRISTIAKGAKKNRSKFLSSTLNFCFGEYVLYKGKSLYSISECQIIDSFQELLRDFNTITYASYLCELIDICLQEEEPNIYVFRQLVTAFYLIKNKAVDIEVLIRAFEVKILKATGYGLNLNNCCICKKYINSSNYINTNYLGGVCESCKRINGIKISYAAYNALKFLNKVPLERVYRVSLSKEVKNEIYKVLYIFISENYFRKPKSLKLLNCLEGGEKYE